MAPKVREDSEPIAQATAEAEASVNEQYIITTDNPNHTGTIMGVQITNGRGLLNRQSVDPRLKRSFEQVVRELKTQPGYHVTPA